MEKLDYTVEIREMPVLHVACVNHAGAYNTIGKAFEELSRWAGPRGFFQNPDTMSLAIYHDDPAITDPDKLRSSACITVPEGTEVSGAVSLMDVPGGTFAAGHFTIRPDQFGLAWDTLMQEWFPASGWQPDDRMCYEVYLNDPSTHPEGKFIIDILEPVKPV